METNVNKLREEAKEWLKRNENVIYRSCWNCNPTHEYLRYVDYPFLCPWCGHWFYRGVDITEEGDEE